VLGRGRRGRDEVEGVEGATRNSLAECYADLDELELEEEDEIGDGRKSD
jgi:hypothetical protein